MKIILSLIISVSSCIAQSDLSVLMAPQTESSISYSGEYVQDGTISVKASNHYCKVLSERRAQLDSSADDYYEQIKRLKPLSNLCYIQGRKDDNGLMVGFELYKEYENGSNRSIAFSFKNRSLVDPVIEILDDSALTGRMSHDFLHTEIQFIPRRVIPYIRFNTETGQTKREVIISTGESIVVNFATNKIVGGVLSEQDPDMTASRHERKFANIKYSGFGLMIRADRRAGTPRHTHNVSFNRNEKIDKAEITFQGKTCYVLKEKIWSSTHNHSVTAYLKYEDDQKFLDEVIEPECGWKIDLKTLHL